MKLNTLSPAAGAKQTGKRVGRGIGSGLGKTCGRGHKGQHSRSGGYHKVGFEGGQMPLQRRLPKMGFTSRKSLVTTEVPLSALARCEGDVVDLASLKAAGLIQNTIKYVKVMLSGEIKRAMTVKSDEVKLTQGAAKAIKAAGGKIEGEA